MVVSVVCQMAMKLEGEELPSEIRIWSISTHAPNEKGHLGVTVSVHWGKKDEEGPEGCELATWWPKVEAVRYTYA